MTHEQPPGNRWFSLDDIPWGKVLLGAGTVIGGIWVTVANSDPKTSFPADTEIRAQVRELEATLRQRLEALEQYRQRQETFSYTRSAEIDRQIQEIRKDLDWIRQVVEKNRDRLDDYEEQRSRRKP